jgi:hypothetical protein
MSNLFMHIISCNQNDINDIKDPRYCMIQSSIGSASLRGGLPCCHVVLHTCMVASPPREASSQGVTWPYAHGGSLGSTSLSGELLCCHVALRPWSHPGSASLSGMLSYHRVAPPLPRCISRRPTPELVPCTC